jgi:hypothetical protein
MASTAPEYFSLDMGNSEVPIQSALLQVGKLELPGWAYTGDSAIQSVRAVQSSITALESSLCLAISLVLFWLAFHVGFTTYKGIRHILDLLWHWPTLHGNGTT